VSWQGVVLPANFRVDAWVTPPAYTGKPPIILAGIHPGETARAADAASESVTVPAGSTLVVRATGKLHLDVSDSGGVTAANEAMHAPSGMEEYRFKIAAPRIRSSRTGARCCQPPRFIARRRQRRRMLWEFRSVCSTLARISHTTECIGVANQRKPLCRYDSSSIRGAPRCRQSVAGFLWI
jgi:Domain of unknown function (DUF4175)